MTNKWHTGMMWGSRVIVDPTLYPDFDPMEDDSDGEAFTERLLRMQAEVTEKFRNVFPFYRFHLQKRMRMHMIAEAHFGLIVADELANQNADKYGRNPLPGQGAYTLRGFFQTAFDRANKGEEIFAIFADATRIARMYDLLFPEPQPLIYHHLDR